MNGSNITSALVEPILDIVSSNVSVMLPVGIGILGVMVGVSLIPRIVYKFL